MNNIIISEIEQFLDEPEVNERIIDALVKTKNTGNEHGFYWAIVDDDVIMSNTVAGDSKGLDIEDEIDFRDFIIFEKHGDFHTHPYRPKAEVQGIFPSGMDIYNTLLNRTYFFCIAAFVNGTTPSIKCFPTNTIKETIQYIKEYLESINEPHEFFDATQELRASMIYRPDTWEKYIFEKTLSI